MIVAFFICFTMLVLFYVVYPLFTPGTERAAAATAVLYMEREEALLGSLRELVSAKERGEVSEDDYPAMERRLLVDIAMLREERGDDAVKPAAKDGDTGDDLVCPSCGGDITSDFLFCPSCGKFLAAA